MPDVPMLMMNNGRQIPQLGFGVFQTPPEQTAQAVVHALEAGYRHIDTAQMYRNEAGVGEGIQRSDVDPDDVFVTSKLNNGAHGRDDALRAFDDTLKALGTETIDLFLIHWPQPKKDLYVETWKALEEVYRDGRARSIGVSNFTEQHLGRLAAECEIPPALNQIELHPFFSQAAARRYNAEHQILTEAWSPIGGQGGSVLDDPTIKNLAGTYGKSPAQITLRWHIQLGNVVIPKSVTPSRIRENYDIFDFELSDEDMAMIDGLDTGNRVGGDPEKIN